MVVTGGGSYIGIATVQVYSISGPQEQLPDMLQGRNRHACAHYVDSQNRVVSRYRVFFFLWIQSGGCKTAILKSFKQYFLLLA